MSPAVLAFSGGLASSASVPWLAEQGLAVVTVTLDVGQGETLAALRARAAACGAVRAHAVDAREELAREVLFPSLDGRLLGAGSHVPLAPMAVPLIARTLVDLARIEGSRCVAHGATHHDLDEAIHAVDPTIEVRAPARTWPMNREALVAYARLHGASAWIQPSDGYRVDQTLWGRRVSWRESDPVPPLVVPRHGAVTQAVHLEVAFEHGVPVAVNGVPMAPVELVESVALIAGRCGIGRLEAHGDGRCVVYDVPAAAALHAARAAVQGGAGVARLSLLNGQCTVLAPHDPQVVNHA